MADLGSVQLLAFAFDVGDRLPSDVAREVRRLRARGVIGVLDVLIVSKDASGGLRYEAESSDLDVSSLPSDSALSRLFEDDTSEPGSVESLELHSFGEIGLDLETIETFARRLQPGTTLLLLLVEATWASALRDAALAAEGFPIMFGCLEPETMLVLGPSLARAAAAPRTRQSPRPRCPPKCSTHSPAPAMRHRRVWVRRSARFFRPASSSRQMSSRRCAPSPRPISCPDQR